MASHDLRRILTGWNYEPGKITVRKIHGENGSVKIQMRLDLGVLQMEIKGRPDGVKPHGDESFLEHHVHRLDQYVQRNGTDLGFELTPEECQALREEAVQYYHRYLSEFVLEDFEGVERDTARNIRVLDICRRYAAEELDRAVLEQYRPYLIMMNTRAQVHVALRRGAFRTGLARIKAGLRSIQELLVETDQEDMLEETNEGKILIALGDEIAARLPEDPIQKMENELQKAVDDERYEDAIILRQRLEAMRTKRTSASVRKRKR